jgi:hypothetical protein
VAGQDLCALPAPCLGAEVPQLDLAVAAACDKAPRRTGLVAARADDLAGRDSRGPRDAVHAAAAGLEDLVRPGVVLELEHRHVAVGGGAGEQAAGLVGRPGDDVDRGRVQGDFVDLLPGGRLLAPDDDLAVVRRRGEDVAVLGMRPCHAPYGAFVSAALSTAPSAGVSGRDVPSQCLDQCVFVALDLEDLDGLVRRARRQPPAVVVEHGIVLHLVSLDREQVDVLPGVGHCVLGVERPGAWSRVVGVPVQRSSDV